MRCGAKAMKGTDRRHPSMRKNGAGRGPRFGRRRTCASLAYYHLVSNIFLALPHSIQMRSFECEGKAVPRKGVRGAKITSRPYFPPDARLLLKSKRLASWPWLATVGPRDDGVALFHMEGLFESVSRETVSNRLPAVRPKQSGVNRALGASRGLLPSSPSHDR